MSKSNGRGSNVGYGAKTKKDCRWNPTRVAFYKALRKIGGSGEAAAISKASKGEVSLGNCLHYGYHGVTPGLNRVEQHEDVKGFVFVLTAKGKSIDLDKQLAKGKVPAEKPAKAKSSKPKKQAAEPPAPVAATE